MATSCRTLIRISLASFNRTKPRPNRCIFSPRPQLPHLGLGLGFASASSLPAAAAASSSEPAAAQSDGTVEELLTKGDKIERLMKMERRSEPDEGRRWFPYLDVYKAGSMELGSGEVIESLDPYIMEARKERIRKAAENRSYSVCLVVEGLTDFGNVSAAFRSADALGIQSVHVILNGGKKRCCYF